MSVCLSACLLVFLLFYTRTWHNKQSETSSGVALTRCRVDSPPRAMSVPATSAPPCSSRSPRTLFSIYSSACTHSTIHRSLNSPVAISTDVHHMSTLTLHRTVSTCTRAPFSLKIVFSSRKSKSDFFSIQTVFILQMDFWMELNLQQVLRVNKQKVYITFRDNFSPFTMEVYKLYLG